MTTPIYHEEYANITANYLLPTRTWNYVDSSIPALSSYKMVWHVYFTKETVTTDYCNLQSFRLDTSSTYATIFYRMDSSRSVKLVVYDNGTVRENNSTIGTLSLNTDYYIKFELNVNAYGFAIYSDEECSTIVGSAKTGSLYNQSGSFNTMTFGAVRYQTGSGTECHWRLYTPMFYYSYGSNTKYPGVTLNEGDPYRYFIDLEDFVVDAGYESLTPLPSVVNTRSGASHMSLERLEQKMGNIQGTATIDDVAADTGDLLSNLAETATNVGNIIDNFLDAGEFGLSALQSLLDDLTSNLATVTTGVTDTVTAVVTTIPGVLSGIVSDVGDIVVDVGTTIPGALASIASGVSDAVTAVVTTIPGVLDTIITWVTTTIPEAISDVATAISGVAADATSIVAAVTTDIPGTLSGLIDDVATVVSDVASIVTAVGTAIPGTLTDIADSITSVLSGLNDEVFGLPVIGPQINLLGDLYDALSGGTFTLESIVDTIGNYILGLATNTMMYTFVYPLWALIRAFYLAFTPTEYYDIGPYVWRAVSVLDGLGFPGLGKELIDIDPESPPTMNVPVAFDCTIPGLSFSFHISHWMVPVFHDKIDPLFSSFETTDPPEAAWYSGNTDGTVMFGDTWPYYGILALGIILSFVSPSILPYILKGGAFLKFYC
jgi:hypothetical protein